MCPLHPHDQFRHPNEYPMHFLALSEDWRRIGIYHLEHFETNLTLEYVGGEPMHTANASIIRLPLICWKTLLAIINYQWTYSGAISLMGSEEWSQRRFVGSYIIVDGRQRTGQGWLMRQTNNLVGCRMMVGACEEDGMSVGDSYLVGCQMTVDAHCMMLRGNVVGCQRSLKKNRLSTND
eukprot:Gb_13860 [translate_table: standard]